MHETDLLGRCIDMYTHVCICQPLVHTEQRMQEAVVVGSSLGLWPCVHVVLWSLGKRAEIGSGTLLSPSSSVCSQRKESSLTKGGTQSAPAHFGPQVFLEAESNEGESCGFLISFFFLYTVTHDVCTQKEHRLASCHTHSTGVVALFQVLFNPQTQCGIFLLRVNDEFVYLQ